MSIFNFEGGVLLKGAPRGMVILSLLYRNYSYLNQIPYLSKCINKKMVNSILKIDGGGGEVGFLQIKSGLRLIKKMLGNAGLDVFSPNERKNKSSC